MSDVRKETSESLINNTFDSAAFSGINIEILLKESFDLLFITDPAAKIISAAGKLLPKITKRINDFINSPVTIFFPAKKKFFKEVYDKALNEKKSFQLPFEFEIQNEMRYFYLRVVPVEMKSLDKFFVVLRFTDVSDSVEKVHSLEEQLKELTHYQIITENAVEALFCLNKKGEITFWNKSCERIFEYKKSEIFGKKFGKIFRAYSEEEFNSFSKIIFTEGSFQAQKTIYLKDNSTRVVKLSFTSALIHSEEKSIVVIADDVTEKLKLESELKLSEERFRTIVQTTTDLICNIDTKGKIIYCNPAFVNAFGYSEKKIYQLNFLDLIDKEFLEEKNFNINSIISSSDSSHEISVRTKAGELKYLSSTFSIVYDLDSTVKLINCIFYDITEKKKSEQELLMFHSIFESSKEGIAVAFENKFIMVNDAFAKIFGYDNGGMMVGMTSLDVIADEEKEKISQILNTKITSTENPSNYEILGVAKDGSNLFIDISVTTVEFAGKNYIVAFVRDITERKRTQQAIKESEQRYRSITENIDDYFWTAERIGNNLKTIFYTASVKKITGYSQMEMLADSKMFFKIVYPDDFGFLKESLKKFYVNYYKNSEAFEFRIIHKMGHIVWVRNKLSVIRDKDGKILKIFGLVTNISLQKKAESELKSSSLNLKKLNETKDRFISIISHDLRTPFSSILGFTDMLLNENNITEAERKQYVKFIQDSSKNMLNLVNSLLEWTRLQTGRIRFEPSRNDLYDIVQSAISNVSGFAIKKGIQIINNVEKETYVFVEENLIMQVFGNLFSNSLKFTKEGGSITVYSSQSKQLRFFDVFVKDTGVGIARENIHKIFKVDEKFTTEGTQGEKGTGLGLSLVQEIIEKHGGSISVESELNKGTTFIFSLPKASATILLVDDSTTDKILYSKLIKSFIEDYFIETCSNGKEALEKIKQTTPALIITDHNMPVMNGYEFAQAYQALDIKGKPPLIILSGDIGKSEIIAYNDLGIEYVFQKPVNLKLFKEAISSSLQKIPN